MQAQLKVLIIGGYGIFGGRLVKLLADHPQMTLMIAGRSHKKASAFCQSLPARATLVPFSFDRNGDLDAQLRAAGAEIAVDATGPFQKYGRKPYRLVETCIALGIHYLDFADGSDFVEGIGQFDAAAKAANIFILSGVSSFPVLTAAVTRHLSCDLKEVHHIIGGIAPSPYAGVGYNVIRAIASYAGKPIRLVRDGHVSRAYAMTETMRYTVSPPGRLPLKNLRFSLVDVPDLLIVPKDYPDLRSIWMGAGPVPEILQRMLNLLSWLVRLRLLPSLLPFARLFYQAINILRWGEHRGGMFVAVRGIDTLQRTVERSWHLLAEGDHGPLIPSMAIEAILRRVAAGMIPSTGARAATHELELEDYNAMFQPRSITTGFRGMKDFPQETPLYARLLEDAWDVLPEPVQAMHCPKQHLHAHGIANVERGKSLLSRWIARCIGFPETGTNIPLTVDFHSNDTCEIWQRTFARQTFRSVQSAGKGRYQHLLCEKFGCLNFGLALVLEEERLQLVVRKWDIFGIPLPAFFAPRGKTYESADNGIFRFHVEIMHPFVGLIVRYYGTLTPEG